MLSESEFKNPKCTRPGCGAEAVIEDDESGIVVRCTVCTNEYWLHEFPEMEEELAEELLEFAPGPQVIELKSELTGYLKGVKCELQPYRARLVKKAGNPHVLVEIGQPFKDGHIGWGPGWRLETLLDLDSDELAIDFGQGWIVAGINKLLLECKRHLVRTISLKED